MRTLAIIVYAGLFFLALGLDMRARVMRVAMPHIAFNAPPARYTGIVLGCRVNDDDVSLCLEERLARALDLYRAGKVKRLLLSGDHGQRGYDEVNTMKHWLVARGVPLDHIFLDHAGFDTYDSMVRARKVFGVDSALVITQAFHLPRAVYLAQHCGITAEGVPADPSGGSSCRGSAVREPMACVKAVFNATFRSAPKFLGPAISITGPSWPSFDRVEDRDAQVTEPER